MRIDNHLIETRQAEPYGLAAWVGTSLESLKKQIWYARQDSNLRPPA